MPKQTQGFNDQGESQWFNGSRLPEGYSYTDPTLKVQEEPEEVHVDKEHSEPTGYDEKKSDLGPDGMSQTEAEPDEGTPLVDEPETVPDTPDIAPRQLKRKSRKRTK